MKLPFFKTEFDTQVGKGIGLMLLACGLLTANDALMKALVENLPVGQVIGIRGIFALTAVLLMAPWVGGFSKLRANKKSSVVLCSGLLLFNIVVFPLCLPYMAFADAIILAYTSPIWVVALAPLLIKERTRWQQWIAVVIGFGGACLVIKPTADAVHWAVLIPLVVAFVVGLRDIVTRKIAASESALSIVAYTNVFSIIVGLLSIFLGWKALTGTQFAQLAVSGLFFSVAQILMVEAFRRVEATVLSTFKYSSILFAALFGFLFWGEFLDFLALGGATLIIISGLVIVRYRHKPMPTIADVMPRAVRSSD
jgi:drug/metabolite transporter (DMT)-like permease